MENKKNSIQEEFKSSRTYKAMQDNNLTRKIAKGIDTTAGIVDGIVEDVKASSGNSKSGGTNPANSANPTTSQNPNVKYNYNYTYNQNPQGNKNPQYPQQPPYQQQGNTYNNPNQRPNPQVYTNYVNPRPYIKPKVQKQYKTKGYKANKVPVYDASKYKAVREPSISKYMLTGITAMIYALAGPLYRPFHYLIYLIVVVGAFALFSLTCRGKVRIVPIEQPTPVEKKPEEPKVQETGNPEVDKIIKTGNEYIKKLRAADDAIPDENVSECIERMAKASEGIFDYIAQNPSKAPQIRKFMNYYLPTTLKLLESYQRLDGQTVKGENIQSTLDDIDRIMHTIATAFENQLDSLFSDEALDISADISVFEAMLQQEGFAAEERPLNKEKG